jgi:hypothetical protein
MGSSGGSKGSGGTPTTTATKTGNYTAVAGQLVPCDTSGGAFTVTLPAANSSGQMVIVRLKTTASGNAVTVARAGSDTINGALTSIGLGLAGQALGLTSDGAGNWNIGGDTSAPALGQAPVTLTDAATIAVDASLGSQFKVTLGGNRTLANPTGAYAGQMLLFVLKQDGTGSRTLALDTKFRFGTDITSITLTTTAAKTDYLGARYNLTDDKFDVISFIKGF